MNQKPCLLTLLLDFASCCGELDKDDISERLLSIVRDAYSADFL